MVFASIWPNICFRRRGGSNVYPPSSLIDRPDMTMNGVGQRNDKAERRVFPHQHPQGNGNYFRYGRFVIIERNSRQFDHPRQREAIHLPFGDIPGPRSEYDGSDKPIVLPCSYPLRFRSREASRIVPMLDGILRRRMGTPVEAQGHTQGMNSAPHSGHLTLTFSANWSRRDCSSSPTGENFSTTPRKSTGSPKSTLNSPRSMSLMCG